ncbi:2-phospho-L-lactate guanylyltransferase [Streptomyces sp. DSM 44915]|uniref:Phosphoenolpyruvate guanylyltransferase n=1 Tax=Streptomyces chisholmiae TaxID=3075540 RepID=A0ABU2JWN1_9ACTN|nr:2-phospho-L-lactate guanylyltransferase [Streptomyces sp. DSM 44915]MDT0269372.1 2-phospho-L-lactate guanylyltransferase [Streptomyces sp. DSM 44915]
MRDCDWALVVPLKPLRAAKSRLAGAVGDADRRALALAFAEDTVAAALRCPAVRDVVVVTSDPEATRALTALGAGVVPDRPDAGLNAALAHGAATLPGRAVAAMNADLPALRPAELGRVLALAAERPRAFLPDAAGVGTTLLAARAGVPLAPAFGGPSRARHRDSGAVELSPPGVASVRRDVDTVADLAVARTLGVGPRTAALLRELPYLSRALTPRPAERRPTAGRPDGRPAPAARTSGASGR